MKLEAREKTGDVLAEIDELIGSVNKTSAKMRFENLLPTCETVSYTHLDVYKRQEYKGSAMFPFILETSPLPILNRGRKTSLAGCKSGLGFNQP